MLKYGDTIGIIAPSWVADRDDTAEIIKGLEALGFRVKTGGNIYKDTWRVTASAEERAQDLNAMLYDKEVKLIFFGGGYGAVDLLPYIDYEQIKRDPKLFLSYSDGTSILSAIYAKTGLTTYYGQTPGLYKAVSEYDRQQFLSHLIQGGVTDFVPNSPWHTITPGRCQGRLLGGYLLNFVLTLGSPLFPYPKSERYILFIEEPDVFRPVEETGVLLTCLGQSGFMGQVTGLLFGHHADEVSAPLFKILQRFGEQYHIPVAYCDDFGHGSNHAILPIGRDAVLDTQRKTLCFK